VPGPALAVSSASRELLDAAVRMLRLLDTPEDIPVLAPPAAREILYRLPRSDQTGRMSRIASVECRLQQANRAIGWIERNFSAPFSMEVLAPEAGMSGSVHRSGYGKITWGPRYHDCRVGNCRSARHQRSLAAAAIYKDPAPTLVWPAKVAFHFSGASSADRGGVQSQGLRYAHAGASRD
jgi:hypothetical protein